MTYDFLVATWGELKKPVKCRPFHWVHLKDYADPLGWTKKCPADVSRDAASFVYGGFVGPRKSERQSVPEQSLCSPVACSCVVMP
jgi:hypothetical protein